MFKNNRAFHFYNSTIIQNNVPITYNFVAIYCNDLVHFPYFFCINNMNMLMLCLFLE